MKKPKFKFIESKQENGCGIACAAMILGREYDDVVINFKNNFDKEGIEAGIIADYLSENGVDVVSKVHHGYVDRLIMNERMLKPFADIHYISFQQFADLDFNHAIIMLANGKLICPNVKHKVTAWDIYSVSKVIGCYYDK